jgi:hypothetical protein
MYPRIGQFDGILGPDGEGPGLKPSTAVSSDSSASPVTAAQNTAATDAIGANRMAQAMPSSTASSSPKAQKPIDKSNWDRSIKVSQSTVDSLKKMGIKAAGEMSKTNAGAEQGGVVAEMQEATKRVYPSAYTASGPAAKSGKDSATFGGGTKPTDPKAGATFGGAAPKVDPKAGTTFGSTTTIPKKTDPKAGATIGGKAPKIGK